ncbi:hypothetical protein D9757_011894 [Collybiopsis confluens]|uniref:Uncharacterized protein n=1 Tax=Collybiopsis confluens TaxID=2823264 RepID=A0A8H5LP47_9AGAR|nr:hypothetical protein D9757_011894 [Collybiopsis confluens]
MRITSAYLLACLFSIGYAFPVEESIFFLGDGVSQHDQEKGFDRMKWIGEMIAKGVVPKWWDAVKAKYGTDAKYTVSGLIPSSTCPTAGQVPLLVKALHICPFLILVMHITSAYLLACLFAVGYAFPVENKHSIRAPPKGSSAAPVIKVRFTSKTTTDAHALEAMNAEVFVRQLLGRQSIKNQLAHGSDQIEFTNHNGESEIAYFEVTGPEKLLLPSISGTRISCLSRQPLREPLVLSCAETDHTVPLPSRRIAEDILIEHRRQYYFQALVWHGFASRCVPNISDERRGREQSAQGISGWFHRFLDEKYTLNQKL